MSIINIKSFINIASCAIHGLDTNSLFSFYQRNHAKPYLLPLVTYAYTSRKEERMIVYESIKKR
jgi:hypothetical protein